MEIGEERKKKRPEREAGKRGRKERRKKGWSKNAGRERKPHHPFTPPLKNFF